MAENLGVSKVILVLGLSLMLRNAGPEVTSSLHNVGGITATTHVVVDHSRYHIIRNFILV